MKYTNQLKVIFCDIFLIPIHTSVRFGAKIDWARKLVIFKRKHSLIRHLYTSFHEKLHAYSITYFSIVNLFSFVGNMKSKIRFPFSDHYEQHQLGTVPLCFSKTVISSTLISRRTIVVSFSTAS